MPKKKNSMPKKRFSKPVITLGDYVEIEGIDSGATWTKSFESPDKLSLAKIRWSGRLVRRDKKITAVDVGGTVKDDDYSARHDYQILWTPAVTNVRLIKKNRR